MSNKIIIMIGKKQSGKDTSLDAIENIYNISISDYPLTRRYAFADPLKQFLIKVFNLSPEQCYGTNEQKNSPTQVRWMDVPLDSYYKKKCYINSKNIDFMSTEHLNWQNEFLTARELMQIFGTDICRNMYNDCWANATKKIIEEERVPIALISDCRFPNELEQFAGNPNVLVLRLLRQPFEDHHASEKAFDDYIFGEKFKNVHLIDNRNMSLEEKNKIVTDIVEGFINEVH